MFKVDLEDESLIADVHPYVSVDSDTHSWAPLNLRVSQAAVLTVREGEFPAGTVLQATDERSGEIYGVRVRGKETLFRIPGRPVLLSGMDERAQPIPCQRISLPPGSTRPFPAPPVLGRGRGQLFLGFVTTTEVMPNDGPLNVEFVTNAEHLRADLVVPRLGGGVYAVWFNAPQGKGSIAVLSRNWTPRTPPPVDVPDRGIRVLNKIPLFRKPTLTLSFDRPDLLGTGTASIELLSCKTAADPSLPPPVPLCTRIAAQQITTPSKAVFMGVDADLLAVRWKKDAFENASWVDLSSGESRDHVLSVTLIELHGRVTKRSRGVSALLAWEAVNSGARYRAFADDDGVFRLTVAQGGSYGVGIRTRDGAAFTKDVVVGDAPCCDFEVPLNRVKVLVTSAGKGPVSGAKVLYELFAPVDNSRKDMGTLRSDEGGQVTLANLEEGTLKLRITAAGYRAAYLGPVTLKEDSAEQTLTALLQPGAGVRLRLLQPSGAPAAGSWVWTDTWGDRTDEQGVVICQEVLPKGAPIIAFDARGEMGFFRYTGEDQQDLVIPMPGPPIRIRFESPDGRPLDKQNVLLGLDGVQDTKGLLDQRLFSGSDVTSGADGLLRINGVPAQGTLSVVPFGHPDLTVTRLLPVSDEIRVVVPVGSVPPAKR